MVDEPRRPRVGHWSDPAARTGCTVVLLPEGTVASGEVRGGAPATREFALLEPGGLVDRIDAVVLTGGSAFGLATADGVVGHLEAHGIGFPTGTGPVPLVVALGLYDLAVGESSVRPGPAQGRMAAEAAALDEVWPPANGAAVVGAGTGATVGKWRGRADARPGALGTATVRHGELEVVAIMAVNAFGDVVGDPVDGGGPDEGWPPGWPGVLEEGGAFTNTTIGVVVTNGVLDQLGCRWVARSAHHGLARAVRPSHTVYDGDAVVVAATGSLGASPGAGLVAEMAAEAVSRAVRAVGAVGESSTGAP